jgi:uncharacterized heparinase superfamily protein
MVGRVDEKIRQMSKQTSGSFGNRLAMWRALRATPAQGFVSQPEPRSIGLFARGKQLISGNFIIAGQVVTAPNTSIWDVKLTNPAVIAIMPDARAGFAWLDDLAAVGDMPARQLGQAWTWEWMWRYGRGQGAGWSPDLTGRRVIRWINHAPLLLSGRSVEDTKKFYHLLSAQVVFLSRRWSLAAPGLPRFEALTGLIYAGLALKGMAEQLGPVEKRLAAECATQIDKDGGISTRNPEELLEVFTHLIWAEQAMTEAGRAVPPALTAAIMRIAPTLRALRHADGDLARFHGGGRGTEGRLDQSLSAAGVKSEGTNGLTLTMGYARLSGGRTTVIVDVAPPAGGSAGRSAHASTAAFELTSGRRPLIVSCGSGRQFGVDWWRAGRSTASHSTLSMEGNSSSRFGITDENANILMERAQVSDLKHAVLDDGMHLSLKQDGWARTHGLTHAREVWLTPDGRKLAGLDRMLARSTEDKARLQSMLSEHWLEGISFALRFHLHPDVTATVDMGGTAISLALKSGEVWVFRYDGRAALTLEPSIYLEKSRLRPRNAQQIVLTWHSREEETRIGWTLAKAQDTPLAIRDLGQDDLPVPH